MEAARLQRERTVRSLFGSVISPAIERASAAREQSAPVERPQVQKPPPSVVHLFGAVNVVSYSELMAGIRQKVAALGIRYLDFDELAGFAPGLSGKVFGPCETKRLGPEKLFDAIRAAGLRIRLEEDPEQTAKMSRRIAEHFNPRQANQARVDNRNYPPNETMICRVLNHLSNHRRGIARLNMATKEALSNRARRSAETKRLRAEADSLAGPQVRETSANSG